MIMFGQSGSTAVIPLHFQLPYPIESSIATGGTSVVVESPNSSTEEEVDISATLFYS